MARIDPGPQAHPANPRVLAVVVAFQRKWSEIAAATWLLSEATRTSIAHKLDRPMIDAVLVYDNSPVPTALPPPSSGALHIIYVHDAANSGTRGAYLRALETCRREGQDWALLLDQDTVIPPDFLDSASAAMPGADVVVPRVRARATIISPAMVTLLGRIRPIGRSASSANARLTAIASGLLLKAPVLALLEHAPEPLWLDYVDHWLFREIHGEGYRIALSAAELRHELSVLSIEHVPAGRLHNIWAAEHLFVRTLGLPARLFYWCRIVARLVWFSVTCRHCAKTLVAWLRSPVW